MVTKDVAERYTGAREGKLAQYRAEGEQQAYNDACAGRLDGDLEEIVAEYIRCQAGDVGFPEWMLERDLSGLREYWAAIRAEVPYLDGEGGFLNPAGEAFLNGWIDGASKFLAEVAKCLAEIGEARPA